MKKDTDTDQEMAEAASDEHDSSSRKRPLDDNDTRDDTGASKRSNVDPSMAFLCLRSFKINI